MVAHLGRLVCLSLLAGCSASSPPPPGTTSPAAQLIGAEGGLLTFSAGSIAIPAGALSEGVEVTITPVDQLDVAPLALPATGDRYEFASKVFAFTPHGQQFAEGVQVVLRHEGRGDLVVRLDDRSDTTWEALDGVAFENGEARFTTRHFSFYAVVRRLPREGEPVITIFDSRTRSYGTERAVFDDGRLFWTRDDAGKLAVLTAQLSGPVPAQERVLFEVPWTPDPGWASPPLIATTTHLAFPTIGQLQLNGQLVRNDGFSSLRRDGTGFVLKFWDNWWSVPRGAELVMDTLIDEFSRQVSPADGSSVISGFPNRLLEASCLYEPVADEAACLNYGFGLFSYRFATATQRWLGAHDEIGDKRFGSNLLKVNATHWFAPAQLPSGWGINAFARDGSGITHYENVPAMGAIAVDDQHLYACLDGVLTRIALTPERTRVVLAEDCSVAEGVSLLGADATYVYYVHSAEGAHQLHLGQLELRRVAKQRAP